MFTRTDLLHRTKLDCRHAMGTNAFSSERPESIRHFLLFPSPSVIYHRCKPTNLRVSIRASAAQFQASSLRVRGHAGAYSSPAQRTGTGHPGRCAEIVEAGGSAPLPKMGGPFKPGFGLTGEQHFWQKRYYDFNIRNYPQFVEKLRYIHRNPVKAGLCERPEDWEWSSFRHYATRSEGRVEIESEWTARKRERVAGRIRPVIELPHSSQNRA